MALSPLEGPLLLYCLRVASGLEKASWFRFLTTADWDAVLRQAELHGVGPLLWERFRCPGVVQPPAPVMERLHEQYTRAAADNARKFEQLGHVLRGFHDTQIPVIVLKGAALAQTVYADPAVRSMKDFDLLVPQDDLGRAEDALVQLGYEPRENYPGERVHLAEHYFHLVPYAHAASRTTVEVHWNLVGRADGVDLDPTGLWERARPTTISGVEVQVLAPEDLLFHLCVHAVVLHRFAVKLRDVFDLAETVRRHADDLDWTGFLWRVAEHRLSRCFFCALELARRLCGAPVEEWVLASLRGDLFDECLVDVLRDHVLHTPSRDLFAALWRRQELGSDGFPTGYGDVPLGNEQVWGVEEAGFHELEVEDGRPVRWTIGTATLVVPLDREQLPRRVQAALRIGPRGTALRITANGRTLFHERVPAGEWSGTFDLAGVPLGDRLTLELLSDTFVPMLLDGSDDGRGLGVLVREIRLVTEGTTVAPALESFPIVEP